MAYKIGTTVVIDDSGNIPWSLITGKPTIGDLAGVSVANGTPTDPTQSVYGTGVFNTNTTGSALFPNSYNCYVNSLSGGGTSGTVTITANRRTFNCNCQCRC